MAKKTRKTSKRSKTKTKPKTKQKAALAAPKPAVKSEKKKGPIQPLGDKVVVRPLTPEEMGTRSPSGIIIPDTVSEEKPEQGVVVAVGPGKFEEGKRVPISVKAGDRVLFSKYGYDEVKIGGEEYFVVSESSVLAIINS